MIPSKLVIFTRPWEVNFHLRLADRLQETFCIPKVVFASFFQQAVDVVRKEGKDAVSLPQALRAERLAPLSQKELLSFDQFCRTHWHGLNLMMQTERFLPDGRKERESFLNQHLSVLNQLIEPGTLSLSSMFDHMVYLCAGAMSFWKGGAHFAFVGCGVPAGRVVALQSPSRTWRMPEEDPNAEMLLAESTAKLQLPPETRIDYMRTVSTTAGWSMRQRIQKMHYLRAQDRIDHKMGTYFPAENRHWPLNELRDRVARQLRKTQKVVWDIQAIDELDALGSPFLYMALHMEPEATILMYSPFVRSQLEFARQISSLLPSGHLLLVKENPKMLGTRPAAYYRELQKLPGVRLVHPSLLSTTLTEKSRAVVSIAGTVTIEAALLGKPAYCCGEPPFMGFAKGSGLAMFRALESDETYESLTEAQRMNEWKEWLQGTFPGRSVPTAYQENVRMKGVDASPENVQSFSDYIAACLPLV